MEPLGVGRTNREAIVPFLDADHGSYALGGPDAANALLRRRAVADFGEHIVYLPAKVDVNGYSSLAQTYVDLFATTGGADVRHTSARG